MPRKLQKQKLLEQQEFQRALIDPASINKEERRVSILISTEAPIRRVDYWSGEEYDEVLMHGVENIDMTRASTAKLRFMHGHGKYGELPIGRLENVRIEDNVLRADAIFSEANPDAEMFWRMVLEGTLTEISVGGKKVEMRITEREGQRSLVEVTRWEFHEASLVDIGADPAAGIGRSENNDVNLNQGDIMNQIDELRRKLEALTGNNAADAEIARAKKELDDEISRVNDENKKLLNDLKEVKRKESIAAVVAMNPDVLDADMVKRFNEDPNADEAMVMREMLTAQASQQKEIGFERGVETQGAFNVLAAGKGEINRALTDAIIMRAGVTVGTPHKDADAFRGATLLDMARALTGYTGYDNKELVERAMSTSDFPNLLGNVANRILSIEFERAETTYQLWVTQVDVKDFKINTDMTMDSMGGRLEKIKENGEAKKVELSESAEKWRIYSFAEEITITRQMIINDDFSVFDTVIPGWAEKAKTTVNGHVYDLIQGKGDYASYVMGDGIAIFDVSTHKNISASGAALATATLSAARTAMKRQKDASGKALNISPAFLLVAPEQEDTALQLISSESAVDSSNAGVKNVHKNSVTAIVDAEIDAGPWHLAAKRRTIKVGFLKGTNRMPIIQEKNRDLISMTLQCVFDFGLVAESYRGLYKNAGV